MALSIEPVRIGEAVREALDLIGPVAAQRRVRLNGAEAAASDRHIRADRQRLKQALLNLLSNAVKYNRDGGEVTLSCEETLEQRMRIREAESHKNEFLDEYVAQCEVVQQRIGAYENAIYKQAGKAILTEVSPAQPRTWNPEDPFPQSS